MHRTPQNPLLAAIVVGLAVAVTASTASADSGPNVVKVPAWLARIHYPGTSSEATVYMAGPITIPARLARTQFPGTSSEPTVVVNTVRGTGPGGRFDWISALIGAACALGIAIASTGSLLALRRRRALAHA